jgi:hypothetical protein
VCALPSDVFNIHFNIILTTVLMFIKWSSCRFPTKLLLELLFPLISATCLAHHVIHGPTRQDRAICNLHLTFASVYGSHGFTVMYWYYSEVWARSQNCENPILPLSCQSVSQSVSLSVCPHGTTRIFMKFDVNIFFKSEEKIQI